MSIPVDLIAYYLRAYVLVALDGLDACMPASESPTERLYPPRRLWLPPEEDAHLPWIFALDSHLATRHLCRLWHAVLLLLSLSL